MEGKFPDGYCLALITKTMLMILVNKLPAPFWLDLGFNATILAILNLAISCLAVGGSLRNLTR